MTEELFHLRWAVPVLAYLRDHAPARFSTVRRALQVSPDALRRTLASLCQRRWVTRQPATATRPPRYVLSGAGSLLGGYCRGFLAAARDGQCERVVLQKWSMPTLLATSRRATRFNLLLDALPGVTPRALAAALKDLVAAGLLERRVDDGYPPRSTYTPSEAGSALLPSVEALRSGVVPRDSVLEFD